MVAYLIIRALTGSSVAALAITDAVPSSWLLIVFIAATLAIDGASQIALALTVPTTSFVADSTAARIAVLGTGAVLTVQYLRVQMKRIDRGPRPPAHAERD
jgi:hypothetical protein